MPTVKNHITRQGAPSIAKGLASGPPLAEQRLCVIAPLQDGMAKQRQQSEAQQKRCQGLLAMTNVRRDRRALGCEHVLVCVLALPAPAACLGDLRDVVGPQARSGDQTVVREWLTGFGMDRGHREPLHAHGPLATLQQDLVQRARPWDGGETATPAACLQLLDGLMRLPKGHAFRERGLGSGLAHQEDVQALV